MVREAQVIEVGGERSWEIDLLTWNYIITFLCLSYAKLVGAGARYISR